MRVSGSGKGASTERRSSRRGRRKGRGRLTAPTAYVYGWDGRFEAEIEADSAQLLEGVWRFDNARILMPGEEPMEVQHYLLATNLTPQQVAKGAVSPGVGAILGPRGPCAARPRAPASIRQRSGCNFSRFWRGLCFLSRWC